VNAVHGVIYIRLRSLGMAAHVQRIVGCFVQQPVGVQEQCPPS
jgi:hypothetical protein